MKRLACIMMFSLILAVSPLGCSSKSDTLSGIDPKSEGAHIGNAGKLVGRYIADNKGKTPKNTGEMKDWAAKNSVQEDELLSTRDHEPYEVHQTPGVMPNTILTETTGVNGKKFIWQSQTRAPVGSETTQDKIDEITKLKGGGARHPKI